MTMSPDTSVAPSYTVAQILGSQPTDTARLPAINLKDPIINNIARAILQNIPAGIVFRRDDTYCTVEITHNLESGITTATTVPISANRFCSLFENHICYTDGAPTPDGKLPKPTAMGKQLAEKILACDTWRRSTPELTSVASVRLPIWTTAPDGKKTVTLSPLGYCPTNGIYTIETIDYLDGHPETIAAEHLRRIWINIMAEFPWRAETPDEERQTWTLNNTTHTGPLPTTNRSACCILALMLGQFCRNLIGLPPMGIINANQPGSGKTLLAWLCVTPVWGMPPGSPTPNNPEELQKSLNAALLARKPFLMLDDIPSLANNTINMIVTSAEISARRLGSDETFRVRNRMQIFATGNALSTTLDVERRALIIDLFLADNAANRSFANVLTPERIATPEMRKDLLRFLWAMVQNWITAGCPKGKTSKASFETYSEIIGGIMAANGFGDPFRPRVTEGTGGDLIGRTLNKLLAHIVGDVMASRGETTRQFTLDEILAISDLEGYTETICSTKDKKKSLGRRLTNLRGRLLQDTQGRHYEFGRAESAGSSKYTFHVLDHQHDQSTV